MSGIRKKKRRGDGPLDGLARIGRHYKVRDDAVGISPKLTVSDKLHARFSQLAYDWNNRDHVQQQLAANHPGWGLMHANNEYSVFVHHGEGKMVFANKGTNPLDIQDLKSDLKLTSRSMTKWGGIERMEKSNEHYKAWKKYAESTAGINNFTITGHSLGGGVALHIARFNGGDKAIVFNPALPVTRAMDNVSIPNSRIIRTNHDIVSRGRTAVVDGERLTVPVSDGIRDPLSAHKMDHFVDASSSSKTITSIDKVSTLYDEHAPKVFGALTNLLTGAQLVGDIQDGDIGSFVKHSAEAAISANPLGAAGVTAFEFGSSVARDIRSGDAGKAAKDTIEGAALSTGAFFGVPGLLLGGAVAGATEIGYRFLGHAHPNKPPSESMGGAVTESGLSIDHLRPEVAYADSVSGKADAIAARGALRG